MGEDRIHEYEGQSLNDRHEFRPEDVSNSAFDNSNQQETSMNQDQAKGKFDQLKGKLKQTWGRLSDDEIALYNGQPG